MVKQTRLAPILIALGVLCQAEPASYRITPAEGAELILEVGKTGLLSGKKHVFVFDRYQGSVTYDADNPTGSSVRLVIEAASARCLDDWVSEKDLKKIERHAKEKMLAVQRHPEITFESNKIQPTTGSAFRAEGMLTIRQVSKPVSVNLELESESPQTLWFTGAASLRMRVFDLKPPKAALGMIGTKDEMTVRFKLRATPRE